MKKIIGLLLLLIGIANSVVATDYEMLTDLGSSAETISLGNVEGMNGSASGIFENPASLRNVEHTSIGLFMTTLMDEVCYKNISVASRMPVGVIGFGYSEASVFNNFNSAENPITHEFYIKNTFDYRDSMMKLGYSLDLDSDLSIGASYVVYLRTFGSTKASGANFDLGVLYTQPTYTLSLFGRNTATGGSVNYEYGDGSTGSEKLPVEMVASGKYRIIDGTTVYGQMKLRRANPLMSIGAKFIPREFASLELNAGYRQYLVANQVKGGLALGVTVDLLGLKASYSYEKIEDHPQYDNKSYFSVSVNL